MATQAEIIAGIIKKSVDKVKEQRAAEQRAAADPVAAANADAERRKQNRESGAGPQTGADGYLDLVEQAWTEGTQDAKEKLAATAPPDTYDATLREVARANTQLQMAATNGRSGSVLGIGAESYGAADAARRNDRLGRRSSDSMYRRRNWNDDPNRGQMRADAMSIFNLPFSRRSLGMTRARF